MELEELISELERLELAGERYLPKLGESRRGKEEQLKALQRQVEGCTRCRLGLSRIRPVFGEGNPDGGLFFVGEGPGEIEDRSGRPFVGRSGILLSQLLEEVELSRDRVYIGNIVKCRPPNNRVPTLEEAESCKPYLLAQLEIVKPVLIVTLGRTAYHHLTGDSTPIGRVRGRVLEWRGRALIPTFHPSYLLRNPTALPTAREDFKVIKRVLEERLGDKG
ncbi:MAG: uracil-DNA glycosylase [Campylobacterales bacterium]